MGRYLFTVANAYDEDVYVMIDSDRKYVTLRDFGGSVSIFGILGGSGHYGEQYQWIFAEKHGMTRIQRGTYLGFDAVTESNIIYVTIVSDRHVVCHCFPHDYQYGLIVNAKGYLVEAKYESTWEDNDGNNYKPVQAKQPMKM